MGVEIRDGGGGGGSPSERLLYAAICMVGLTVEVQVKDGSLYSGILHTASFDPARGIVLKKARKIGKGKHEKSFPVGSFVDTLVILSSDFVQVVVKDFLLPAEGGVVNVAGDDGVVPGTIDSHSCNFDLEKAPMPLISNNSSPSGIPDHNKEKMSRFDLANKDPKVDAGLDIQKMLQNLSNVKQDVEARRQDLRKAVELSLAPAVSALESQVGEDMLQGEGTSCNHVDEVSEAEKMVHKDHHPSPSSISSLQADSVDDTHSAIALTTSDETGCGSLVVRPVRPNGHPKSMLTHSTNYPSSDAPISTVSSHSTSVPDGRPSSHTSLSTSPNVPYSKNNSSCKPSAKEFKLNPGAKVFSPMSANPRLSPTPVSTSASAGYISNIPPVMPITVAQSGVEINSFVSHPTPAKLVQYDSSVTGHSGVPVQFSRPVIGQANAWQPPVRFSGQFQPIQAGPAYVHPTSQTVVVGRTGQLVYVHPIAQDATQGATILSQGSPYPLLNPCQTSLPKIQGAAAPPLQLCMAPALVTGATVPGHIPFTQPFPDVRPILVPSGNSFFGSKLQ